VGVWGVITGKRKTPRALINWPHKKILSGIFKNYAGF